ncbi:MAG: hypothetical protein Q9178_002858 [Gyalolechia marmorata]
MSSSTSTVPTTFLIISDTHNLTFDASKASALELPTPQADVLLHCGDLTQIGTQIAFRNALTMLGNIPAELKLVIAGDHDLELDQSHWLRRAAQPDSMDNRQCHANAERIMNGPDAYIANVTYLTEGTHTFTLSTGATFKIYVSPYTPVCGGWAFGYWNFEDRFNPAHLRQLGTISVAEEPIPDDVDIIMTHGPPQGVLDECPAGSVGCPNLLHAVKRVRPMMHCFGHIHEASGAEIVDWKDRGEVEAGMGAWENGELGREEWKRSAVHEYFEEAEIRNPYPEAFEWTERRGYRKGETTLAVNASILDSHYRPSNPPWRIRLDLKRAEIWGWGGQRHG